MHVHTLLFHNLDHGWKIGFRNESEKRETKRRSFRKESKSDYYNTNIPSNGEIARPNACRRSHSTRPPRRKRSRSTASRHATKPNAAANRHYPRNNQRPGGGRETPNAAEGGGTTLFSLAPRCISYFFSFFSLSLSLFYCYFSFVRSRFKVARLSLVHLIIAIFSSSCRTIFIKKDPLIEREISSRAATYLHSFFFF